MHYSWDKTQDILAECAASGRHLGVYDDILCGESYLDLVQRGEIVEYNTVLMLLMDSAQLLESKDSNCWIYIWILIDLGPDKHYKVQSILPGGVIPGPKPPGDFDSFLFPRLAHVSALQHEGLWIWDSYYRRFKTSFLFLLLVLADPIAMAYLSRSVGHHGHKGCQLVCGLIGQNKVRGSHYYPALLRPVGFENHRSSSHPDININTLPILDPEEYKCSLFSVIRSRTEAKFWRRHFNTGIGKPSIFAGIP